STDSRRPTTGKAADRCPARRPAAACCAPPRDRPHSWPRPGARRGNDAAAADRARPRAAWKSRMRLSDRVSWLAPVWIVSNKFNDGAEFPRGPLASEIGALERVALAQGRKLAGEFDLTVGDHDAAGRDFHGKVRILFGDDNGQAEVTQAHEHVGHGQ